MILLALACTPETTPVAVEGELTETVPEDTGTYTDTEEGDANADWEDRVFVAYFAEWAVYDRNYRVWDIPGDKVTHINYAFAQVVDGQCAIHDDWAATQKDGGNFSQLQDLKASYPHVKVLLSVGGWTLSEPFSELATTAEGRSRFASSCADFAVEHGFDGLDIDWEYPVSGGLSTGAPEDRANFTLLLEATRAELDARDAELLLTIAAPAGLSTIDNYETDAIAEHLDWINVMAYDLHGSWSSTVGHNAPMESADELSVSAAMERWLRDVDPQQLTLGVPLYGRGFAGATDIGGPFSGLPEGTWEAGVFDFEDLETHVIDQPGWERRWDGEAQVPYLVNAAEQVVISYDDEESIGLKLDYARDLGLRGVMAWELSADRNETLSTVISGH